MKRNDPEYKIPQLHYIREAATGILTALPKEMTAIFYTLVLFPTFPVKLYETKMVTST